MKVFLSYQFKDNIPEIIRLFNQEGIEVLDSLTDIRYGDSFQKAIKNAILECDFVFIVYASPNPNLAFEAGIAVSSNIPIFSVISETDNDPDFLFDSAYVRALPNEIDKIKFNLDIFLQKVKAKKRTTSIKAHKFYGGGEPNFYIGIHNNYLRLNKKTEKEYLHFFEDIFEKYHLNVIQGKEDNKSHSYADFCIWSDALNNVIGNPILIEIKKEISHNNIKKLQNSLIRLTNNNPAESCLIFYDYLEGIKKNDLPNTSRLLFIQIEDFIEKLQNNDFNESIRKIRNEIVHNQF